MDYIQTQVLIGSYTKGLKSRLKEVMAACGAFGIIEKKLYKNVDEIHDNPIHTEIIAGGTKASIEQFTQVVKEVVEQSTDFEVKADYLPELTDKQKHHIIIRKTDERILNRKASDVGDDDKDEADLLGEAIILTNQVKNRAKQVLNVVSDIPILSEYTNNIMEKWSLTVKELPRELIAAKSLFHPFSVCSFSLYMDDTLSVMKSCLEWKLHIPFNSIELYTSSGVLLTDMYTMMKEKECVFVDIRVTNKFFESEAEWKSKIMELTEEPLVFHKMALHGMNKSYLVKTFL